MKRLLAVLAGLVLFAAAAPTAQADVSPTVAYCEASLRGQTHHAPDNDIKAYWDRFESSYHVNIASSYRIGVPIYYGEHSLLVLWRFVDRRGNPITDKWFHCYWDGTPPQHGGNGIYHDVP